MDAEVGDGRQVAKSKSFMDVVKEDVKLAGVKGESAADGATQWQMIGCGHPYSEKPKKNKDEYTFGCVLHVTQCARK